jgi:hypothetical protein
MSNNGLDALTTCGLERVENENRTKKLRLKWNLIRNAFKYLPKNYTNLKLMHKMMYYDWKKFNTTRKSKFENEFIEGCLGHSVVLTKRAIELCGEWDLRLQEADFDSVRSKVEEMQTFVCENFKDSDNFTTDKEFVELSIELYQNAKYSIEALEENESITTNEVCNQFAYLRSSVNTIRKMTR